MSRDAHLKSMSSYESAAWNDACAIAQFMADFFENDVSRVRELYQSLEMKEIKAFEEKNESFIAEFIGKTEGHRSSYFNKITAKVDEQTKVLFLTLCLLSIVRVRDVIEIRDRYRDVLAPGRGYRLTNKALYEFEREVVGIASYEWPSDPFDAIDVDDGSCQRYRKPQFPHRFRVPERWPALNSHTDSGSFTAPFPQFPHRFRGVGSPHPSIPTPTQGSKSAAYLNSHTDSGLTLMLAPQFPHRFRECIY